MTIIKYILFALLLFGLWVTEPLWMKSDRNHTTASPVDEQIGEHIRKEKKEKDEVQPLETRYLKELEIKFGPKPSAKNSTGVPSSVYEYWNKTLQYPDSLEEEMCGPIRGSDQGWRTVCRYRAKNSSGSLELREDKFIIRNGNVYK